jgi:hypothetical protein
MAGASILGAVRPLVVRYGMAGVHRRSRCHRARRRSGYRLGGWRQVQRAFLTAAGECADGDAKRDKH